MTQRPFKKQNWQKRSITSIGPQFRYDVCNPQMGLDGVDVYSLYAVTDKKEISLSGLSAGGLSKIYSDGPLEIVAGQKNKSTGIDIVITGKNGDVWITAERNGEIRIRGKNIILDADENIELSAGKDINIKASAGRVLLKATEASVDALLGNLPPLPKTFGGISFEGTYVGSDILTSNFTGIF
jgi:hypothetical protein